MTALEHLRHTDRLTTIGQLAAGVATARHTARRDRRAR
jgi:hypothetical protein